MTSKLVELCELGRLPELRLPEERPVLKSDCVGHAQKAAVALKKCANILNEAGEDFVASSESVRECIVPLLLLCGEHTQASHWSNSETIALSFSIISNIKKLFSEEALQGVLLRQHKHKDRVMMQWLCEELLPKVAKDRFKKNPAACSCCVWLLHQLTFPNLSGFVHFFLPFSLCLLGDWVDEHKLLGIQCVQHLVEQVAKTDLVWYGRADLLKSELLHHATTVSSLTDLRVLDAALATYIQILIKTETPQDSSDEHYRMNDTERLLMKVLQSLEVESRHDAKAVLSRHLIKLAPLIKVRILRWMSRLTRTCDAVLSSPGGQESKVNMLQVLSIALTVEGLPPPERHVEALLKTLFRLLYESSKDEEALWKSLSEPCLKCIKLLSVQCPKEYELHTKGLDAVSVNVRFNAAVASIKK